MQAVMMMLVAGVRMLAMRMEVHQGGFYRGQSLSNSICPRDFPAGDNGHEPPDETRLTSSYCRPYHQNRKSKAKKTVREGDDCHRVRLIRR